MAESWTEDDLCALAPVRRLAALLDLDPVSYREGDPLPRGWHFLYFTPATRQRLLGSDGYTPPPADLGLDRPRLMLGGRRLQWQGDLVIGQRLQRHSQVILSGQKRGRSGPLVRATRRHEILDRSGGPVLLTEEEDLIYIGRGCAAQAQEPAARSDSQWEAQHNSPFLPDECLLFRYSALTFNAHRIHYDLAYATTVEGYPGLVVNGGLTALWLMQFFRGLTARQPQRLHVRNRRPLFCGRPATLKARQDGDRWTLRAENDRGETAVEMEIEACSSH